MKEANVLQTDILIPETRAIMTRTHDCVYVEASMEFGIGAILTSNLA